MARPRIYKTEAVVLRQMPLGEADRILTLFTPDRGKVRAVAKGVRRARSRVGGHLELLTCVSISVSQGRNLDVVGEAQVIQVFRGIREDLPKLSQALYIAEIVDRFSVEHSSNEAVYRLLLDTLGLLEETGQPELVLRYFELHLLDDSGYRPELFVCIECRIELDPGTHYFSNAKGGVICPNCRTGFTEAMAPLSVGAMKVLRFLLRNPDYAVVSQLQISVVVMREVERLLRNYLRFLAERDLKSAEFMNLVSSSGRP